MRVVRMWAVGAAVAGVMVAGCSKSEPKSEPGARHDAPAVGSESDEELLARADKAAMALGGSLKGRLQAELPKGTMAAIDVCANEAQAIGARVAEEQGARVGRASTRTRNGLNAQAPAWVRAWLDVNGERPASEAKGISQVDVQEGERVGRVLKPIVVEPSCLACHGLREELAPEVVAFLEERYPGDRATGYRVGDLRGALWAEVIARTESGK